MTPTGYDLSLPDFDAKLGSEEWSELQQSCRSLAQAYIWMEGLAFELGYLCPGTCAPDTLGQGSLQTRIASGCGSFLRREAAEGEVDWREGGLDSIEGVARRASARVQRPLSGFCKSWRQASSISTGSGAALESPAEIARAAAGEVAGEIRAFLDHCFHTLSMGVAGFPAMPPFDTVLERHAPSFQHVPVAGQRWDVLRAILEDLASARGQSSGAGSFEGLRVAEIGVEKGMTAAFIMRNVPAIREYVLVDPWHLPGKPDDFNAVLEGYFQNMQTWAEEEPSFRRDNTSVARVLRMSSQEAAGFFEEGYFDAVFIDAEHTFAEVQKDIATWKRRVRPDGGVIAGHDFSIFHPAVALAVLLECGPGGEDFTRFPLKSQGGRPLVNLGVDSVWWCTRDR